ncbi:LIM domain-containing protein jub [Hypsibius exemplaris]|uniref:LIM domain-containing protein jub n=1 Tax=Hypsibius exemplaris TaxID=2072580 RepID=A0A1W0X223_HYPEX|nr:LIM domain-containing protein jub [Hypsibius exemplaris]
MAGISMFREAILLTTRPRDDHELNYAIGPTTWCLQPQYSHHPSTSKHSKQQKPDGIMQKFDPLACFSTTTVGSAGRDSLGYSVSPPPPYDFARHGQHHHHPQTTLNSPTTTSSPQQQQQPPLTRRTSHHPLIHGSSGGPTIGPTVKPTVGPTVKPTVKPTVGPTVRPTVTSGEPTVGPIVTSGGTTVGPTVEKQPLQRGYIYHCSTGSSVNNSPGNGPFSPSSPSPNINSNDPGRNDPGSQNPSKAMKAHQRRISSGIAVYHHYHALDRQLAEDQDDDVVEGDDPAAAEELPPKFMIDPTSPSNNPTNVPTITTRYNIPNQYKTQHQLQRVNALRRHNNTQNNSFASSSSLALDTSVLHNHTLSPGAPVNSAFSSPRSSISTFASSSLSSPRSSISTLGASTTELRHLGCGSPYSACSPSPALLDYGPALLDYGYSPSGSGRGVCPCTHCLTVSPSQRLDGGPFGRMAVSPSQRLDGGPLGRMAVSPSQRLDGGPYGRMAVSRSGFFGGPSPADTVIVHESIYGGSLNSFTGSTQLSGSGTAARHHHHHQHANTGFLSASSGYNGSGVSCCSPAPTVGASSAGPFLQYQQHHQHRHHTTTPPLNRPQQRQTSAGSSVCGGACLQQQSYNGGAGCCGGVSRSSYRIPLSVVSAAATASATSLKALGGVGGVSPGGGVAGGAGGRDRATLSSSSTTARFERFSTTDGQLVTGAQFATPAFSQHCAPLGERFFSATGLTRNPMNRSRDISAPVFSQPCSEDLDEEPPPYKPPASRPKLPTTTAKNLNRSANVEKKIEQLTEELSNITTHSASLDGSNADFDDDDYYGQCYACSEQVLGEENACQAMGNLYHTSCFVCNICGRILRGKAFYHVKGQIMCEEDYLYSGFQSSADKCVACGHLIMDMILQALGKSYHPGCFRCCTCNKTLDGAPFTVDIEGKIFCIEDYQGRYAPTCASCKLPIAPVEGSDETVRVVSMEMNFHIDCYACEDCGTQLTDKPRERRCFPLPECQLLCYVCHMKRRDKEDRRLNSSVRSSMRGRQLV